MTFPPLAPDLAAHTEAARHDANMRCHARGCVRSDEQSRGRCGWRWASDGCVILCWHYDLPGYGLCARHLTQAMYRARRGQRAETRPIKCPLYAFTPGAV